MTKLLNRFRYLYNKVLSTIAFIPTLMSASAFFFAILILYLEYRAVFNFMDDDMEWLKVRDGDNARTILATIIGGTISLTVFSFSMVMVVLNRASASLSPRLLPQLVAQKSHQVVLGFYMGTIIYSLVLIINVDNGDHVPSMAVLISMAFAISSLGLFIYFINSISMSIQVDEILDKVFLNTIRKIESEISKPLNVEFKETYETFKKMKISREIKARESGYFHSMTRKSIRSKLKSRRVFAEITAYNGQFVEKGYVVLRYHSSEGDQDQLHDELEEIINVSMNSGFNNTYHFGIKQISEIALKALSPGINDPGTAIQAIRHLTILFEKLIFLPPYQNISNDDDHCHLVVKNPGLDQLLFQFIGPIRQCAANITIVYDSLIEFFAILLSTGNHSYDKVIRQHTKALKITMEEQISNRQDLKILKKKLDDAEKGRS